MISTGGGSLFCGARAVQKFNGHTPKFECVSTTEFASPASFVGSVGILQGVCVEHEEIFERK